MQKPKNQRKEQSQKYSKPGKKSRKINIVKGKKKLRANKNGKEK